MARWALVAVIVALASASTTAAAPPTQPSERACLIAWNASTNHANQLKLLAQRPIVGLMLGSGVAGSDTWTKTSSTTTSGPACLMTIIKRGAFRIVTGRWKGTGVDRWTFARAIPATKNDPPLGAANVRLLADGRVTKIYRR